MTSPANQQNPIPAPNTFATTATSYASAAGAPKKAAQPSQVATGSQPPVVVGSSSASLAQNANTSSSSSVNGKPAVAPAVPAVARGSSTNGSGVDHSRKVSVTMAANGPNSYAANGGAKSGIQFGFDSPAMAHSTPHTANAAPIPIPGAGNHRVPSPAHSPSPIPQPSASGGRPPSGLPGSGQMTFGSLSSDGERHMRQGSVPPIPNAMGSQPGAHYRRESSHSVQGDNRANFPPQGGRGRGFNPHNQYNNQMGYPPNNQFRNGPGQGRGMPPSFQPQPRNMPYPNSPQPARSPALVPSMPNTPNMPPATMQPNMTMGTPPQYHYPPPMAPQHQQVQPPLPDVSDKLHFKSFKKSKARRDHAKSLQSGRLLDSIRELRGSDPSQPQRRFQQRPEQQWRDRDIGSSRSEVSGGDVRSAVQYHNHHLHHHAPPPLPKFAPQDASSLDLSPESGGFELWLTMKHQNYGYPPQQMDQYGRPMSMPYGYNNVPPYMGPPQTNPPAYNQQFAPPYAPQQSHSMSRTPSQPERPSSANQQGQPLVVGSSQPPNSQGKPGPNNFVKPRKSAAIQIKNAAGEVVDTSTFKQPVSPAPTGQQSKTPPVVASTPTPPPKSSTPAAHGRSESTATPKTAKEIQDELKEKIKQATQGAAANEAKNKEQAVATTTKAPADGSAEKDAAAASTATPKVEAPKETDKVEEPNKAEEEKPPAEPVADNGDTEEDEIERMIREMEEADAKREKEEEEHRKRAEAEKAEQKKKDEENRKSSAADEDRRLREQEREMERLEEEKERRQKEAEASGKTMSVAEALAAARSVRDGDAANVDSVTDKLSGMKIAEEKATGDAAGQKRSAKPAALNLTPLNTKPVDPPQPSAALQSLKSSRFLQVMDQEIYPTGINSPNPALNAAVAKKGKSFKYDAAFLLQFQKVFTEQPSVEFHQQVKSLIGDGDRSARAQTPRQPSNRGSNTFSMGTFNAPPGRTLPSGTTSEQRMAMSSGTMPRPPVGSIGSFRGPGGGFPGTAMSRTSSQSRAAGPNSPSGRQSSRSTRGSRRDFNTKEAQAAKTMPLTAGQEIKPIAVTSSGWKPTSVGNKPSASAPAANASGYLDPELVQRKVKAALNKMTPENFDRIADQILTIAGQSKDESDGRTLRQVIQLTFEKATDEAHWASMYAKFCKRMLENMSADVRDERIKDKNGNVVSGGNLFRKYLLNRCQEEFERGWSSNSPQLKEEEGAEDSSKKTLGDAAMLSDEYYEAAAAKRRGLGLVQFIGELYKLGMLTERIMHECVHKLVDYKGVPDEAEIESLSKLLRTIGANLDATEKGRPMMDAYFQRIQNMAELPELQSRMKFMLMDVLDLRRANWVSKEANKGPKTLDEVRAEAEAQAAKAQESARTNSRGGPGRPAMGRGDARNFSGGYVQQTSNQVGMDDLRRLKGSASRTASQNVTLGPSSMFASRSNSGRRLGPGGSLGRPGEDSGASSRTGTPPNRDSTSNTNAFSLLANMVDAEHPASPPSAGPSPLLAKAVPDSDKKESE
ncbi:MIF4-like, type 1/2/3 [Metarhizium brunneum]